MQTIVFKAAAKLYGARVNLKCHKTLVIQQLFFVKIYFLLYVYGCLPSCLYVHHDCSVCGEARRC